MNFGLYYYFVIRDKPDFHDHMVEWSVRESSWDTLSIHRGRKHIPIHRLLINLRNMLVQMVELLKRHWNAPIHTHKIYFPDEST